MKKSYIVICALFTVFLLSCKKQSVEEYVRFDKVQNYVVTHLSQSLDRLDRLKSAETDEERIQFFKEARLAFKKAEPFAAYLAPESALRVNGPPLPIYREDNGKVLPPIGLQAIEETIFSEEIDSITLLGQIETTRGFIGNLIDKSNKFEINPRRFFTPVHQQFLRIYSLGLTGFDTPTSFFGIEESIACLESLQEVYLFSIADTIKLLDQNLHNQFVGEIDDAIQYISSNKDFESFNRYEFGRNHLNPMTRSWVNIRKTFGFEDAKKAAINMDAPTFFESNTFNVNFFRTSSNRNPNQDQLKLGELLFYDKSLSASGNLSCETCHQPDLSFQDGLTKGVDKNGNQLLRNTPTLINSIYQKKFFWDGRSDDLEQQITNVFNNEDEFNNNAHTIVSSRVTQNQEYQALFAKAYPNKEFNLKQIIKALSSYTSTLNAMNSRFDRNMRGELDDFTAQEILGMNLYMGKALCATCHFIPLTNGTVPPAFMETEKEILGTPKTFENKEIDPDKGFYWVFQADIHEYMFKTPTVRNSELTAPYMHNGVYETLEQVMDFYNKGGGGGMGFDLPHQTLPFDSLNLNQEELDALVAFLKTFTDTEVSRY